jgi:peptide/nickel transport system substrate-binding protein
MFKRRVSVAALALAGTLTFAATPKDTLVVAKNIEDIVGLDPAEAFEFSSAEVVNNVYQNLVQYDAGNPNHLIPGLATAWTLGTDGKSIDFQLNPKAVFASGNPVRPEDVIFSFSRVVKLNKAPAFILTQLGWTPGNVGQMVQKTGPNRVKVAWPGDLGPAFAMNLLAARPGSVVDEKTTMEHQAGADLGNAWLNQNSAGSGPFKLKLYKPKEVLVLEANPSSPRGVPPLKTVLVKNVSEPATQRLLLESGDVDIARDLESDQVEALRTNKDIVIKNYPQATVHFLSLNQKVQKLRSPAVWEALRYLVDYEGIASRLFKGQMKVHQAFLPDGFPGALNESPYAYNPEKAKGILAKAGIKDLSIDLDLINTPRFMDMAQAMQANMAKGGVKLNLLPGTGSQVITRYRARQHEAMLLYWGPDFFDPHANAQAFAYNVDNSDGNYQSTTTWRNGWLVPELSAMTTAALKEQDPKKRAALYVAIQKKVQRDSPILVTFQEMSQVALRSNVKGYINGLTTDLVFYNQVTK